MHSASGRPGRGAPSVKQSKHSVQSTHSAHPGPEIQIAGSKRPTGSQLQKPAEQVPPSKSEKEAILKRAEGRTRVPSRFRDGFKHFFFSPTGALKVLRMGLLIGSLVCFIIAEAHESYITITVLETGIVLFFILIYMLTLHHLMTCIHWPLLDLINSCITTVFLLIVAFLTMREKERRHLFYVGGSLCLTAAIVCIVDASLVTKMMRNNMKRVLGIKVETSPYPASAEPHQKPNPEYENELIPASSPASTVAPSRASSWAPSRTISRAKAAAPPSQSSHH